MTVFPNALFSDFPYIMRRMFSVLPIQVLAFNSVVPWFIRRGAPASLRSAVWSLRCRSRCSPPPLSSGRAALLRCRRAVHPPPYGRRSGRSVVAPGAALLRCRRAVQSSFVVGRPSGEGAAFGKRSFLTHFRKQPLLQRAKAAFSGAVVPPSASNPRTSHKIAFSLTPFG